jgi:DNA-directed RNA polymerase subunit RPC12/RpoP
MTICFTTRRRYTRSGGICQQSEGFVCLHCRHSVSADQALTGGHNRNHCPYCLSSRHLDLFQAGDRLSACKGRMAPIGLTLKETRSKYARENMGELMLIHQCEACGKVSINRIAADDDAEALLAVYEHSQWMSAGTQALLSENGIRLLGDADTALVYRRLYGQTDPHSMN